MRTPYIGITGFMSKEEVDTVLSAMPCSSKRMIMIGVLASTKTLLGQQNKWPNRYPRRERIRDIFPNHPSAINLIHYNTKEPETLCAQLLGLTKLGGPNLHGFQLNITWPSPAVIADFRLLHPDMVIVLQIGARAFKMMGNNPEKLADKVQKEYIGLVDYMLLDPSGGQGKPLETKQIREYLQALRVKNLGIGFGVAGGLSPTTLGLVKPLAKAFPNLSIDAESRLRDKNDSLDLKLATRYLLRVWQIFGEVSKTR